MSTWAARMHKRATNLSNVVTSCGHPSGPYHRRLEKVKFGVSLDEVCKNDIPAPLLVLILKLNKEAPYRKDIFRAPGHHGAVKKLIHFLQTGRLVNMDNFSVYTIASVLKKFLRKIPGGIFGKEMEIALFDVIEMEDEQRLNDEIIRLISTLPLYTQRILVLLFGTFRVIAANSENASTGMTSEAIGVSVAPSFFHTCVSDGKNAKMEDVMKFKVASRVVMHLIEEFTCSNLFGRDNYEFYTRVTGRILKVQGEWICSFKYPPHFKGISNYYPQICATDCFAMEPYILGHISMGEESFGYLDCETQHYPSKKYELEVSPQPVTVSEKHIPSLSSILDHSIHSTASMDIIPDKSTLLEPSTRLSISLQQNGLLECTCESSSSSSHYDMDAVCNDSRMTLDQLKVANRYAESTRSLSFLPLVHERQTQRMKTRSQWFLASSAEHTNDLCHPIDVQLNGTDMSVLANVLLRCSQPVTNGALSLSAESLQSRPSFKRVNSRDNRHCIQKSSSRRQKHGTGLNSFKNKSDKKYCKTENVKLDY